ncbi:MAG: hypothetical protein EAZ85_08660 [Bacteroidetes bacterium]|nr:MAG: hypothetical protein EAZ85_08660 [Bacteroidota bacterium]TAG87461.1 MAG: hypothetical protein EAZ20_10565 [Bacteroidota bacterium]
MGCIHCESFKGHSSQFFYDFLQVFRLDVPYSFPRQVIIAGTAKCKHCEQKVEFDSDESIIPILDVWFIPADDEKQ